VIRDYAKEYNGMLAINDLLSFEVSGSSKINCSICNLMLTVVVLIPNNRQVLDLESASLKGELWYDLKND
jgi:LSD1 subclass zinc finger protein